MMQDQKYTFGNEEQGGAHYSFVKKKMNDSKLEKDKTICLFRFVRLSAYTGCMSNDIICSQLEMFQDL